MALAALLESGGVSGRYTNICTERMWRWNFESLQVRSFSAALIIAGIIAAIIFGWFIFREPSDYIEGQFDATRIRVSSKLTGRIEDIYVKKGARVSRGAPGASLLAGTGGKYEQALGRRRPPWPSAPRP
jgi:hypothetical protein